MLKRLITVLLIVVAAPAWAQLTQAQITSLRTVVQADPTASALAQAADDVALAAWLNAADATCTVWRHDVTIAEAHAVMVWTEVDGLTAGKARIWEWMRNLGVIDARQANIRQGLSDAFASATATRTALTSLAKRAPTRAERALSSGACTNAAPSIMTFTGQVSYADASLIRS